MFIKRELVDKILRALAFQIGQEVVYSEIVGLVGSDEKMVAKYIDIMEKAFIVFTRMSYARNLRNELRKSRKIFFRDMGIRNYVIVRSPRRAPVPCRGRQLPGG